MKHQWQILKRISLLRGEIEYLEKAKQEVQGGSVVQGDIVNQAGKYARSTPGYISARRGVQRSKSFRRRTKAEKESQEEPRRQETITYTDIPAETTVEAASEGTGAKISLTWTVEELVLRKFVVSETKENIIAWKVN